MPAHEIDEEAFNQCFNTELERKRKLDNVSPCFCKDEKINTSSLDVDLKTECIQPTNDLDMTAEDFISFPETFKKFKPEAFKEKIVDLTDSKISVNTPTDTTASVKEKIVDLTASIISVNTPTDTTAFVKEKIVDLTDSIISVNTPTDTTAFDKEKKVDLTDSIVSVNTPTDTKFISSIKEKIVDLTDSIVSVIPPTDTTAFVKEKIVVLTDSIISVNTPTDTTASVKEKIVNLTDSIISVNTPTDTKTVKEKIVNLTDSIISVNTPTDTKTSVKEKIVNLTDSIISVNTPTDTTITVKEKLVDLTDSLISVNTPTDTKTSVKEKIVDLTDSIISVIPPTDTTTSVNDLVVETVAAELAVDANASTTNNETKVCQNLKAVEAVDTKKLIVENVVNLNAGESEIRPEPLFISSDPQENNDNFNPLWEAQRILQTDSERYQNIRKRWCNLAIPNARTDLTYRHRRRAVAGQRRRTTARRRRTVSCTGMLKNGFAEIQQKFTTEMRKVIDELNLEVRALLAQQQEETRRFRPYRPLHPLHQKHKQDLNNLEMCYQFRISCIEANMRTSLDQYQRYMDEVNLFNAFYSDLGQTLDILTDEQQTQLEETERMYNVFYSIYK